MVMFDQFSQSGFSQNQFSDQLTTPVQLQRNLQKLTGALSGADLQAASYDSRRPSTMDNRH